MTQTQYDTIAQKMHSRMQECNRSAETFLMLSVVRDLADTFAAADPEFDYDRFLNASGLVILSGI